ncbi:MAG: hypothetical protein H6518_12485 [Microthrixaceae bacterium]|nr:hypothetical protein [Microthrixaceae bacterium]
MIGLLSMVDDLSSPPPGAGLADGGRILLLGDTWAGLAGSRWATHTGQARLGTLPPCDLEAHTRVAGLVRDLVAERAVLGAHDVAEGGLALALAEMAVRSGVGFQVARVHTEAELWSESGGRAVVCVAADRAREAIGRAEAAGVPVTQLGLAAGDRLSVKDLLDVGLARAPPPGATASPPPSAPPSPTTSEARRRAFADPASAAVTPRPPSGPVAQAVWLVKATHWPWLRKGTPAASVKDCQPPFLHWSFDVGVVAGVPAVARVPEDVGDHLLAGHAGVEVVDGADLGGAPLVGEQRAAVEAAVGVGGALGGQGVVVRLDLGHDRGPGGDGGVEERAAERERGGRVGGEHRTAQRLEVPERGHQHLRVGAGGEQGVHAGAELGRERGRRRGAEADVAAAEQDRDVVGLGGGDRGGLARPGWPWAPGDRGVETARCQPEPGSRSLGR